MNIDQSPSCCGLDEICELREHVTPEDAIMALCSYYTRFGTKELGRLPAFWLFTGVEKFLETKDGKAPRGPDREDYGSDDEYQDAVWDWQDEHGDEGGETPKYASKFAKFIRRNGLGKTATLGRLPNKNDSNHIVQMWLWRPDHEALKKYYTKHTTPRVGI